MIPGDHCRISGIEDEADVFIILYLTLQRDTLNFYNPVKLFTITYWGNAPFGSLHILQIILLSKL